MKLAGLLRSLYQTIQDPLRRNSLYLLATHGVIGLFGFFFWKIAAAEYGSGEVSQAVTLVNAVLVLHILARLGLDIALIRFLPDEKDRPGMINTALTIVGLSSGGLALVFMLVVAAWFPTSALSIAVENTGYAFLFIVFTVASSVVELLRQGVFVACRSTQSSLAVEVVAGVRLLLLLALVSLGTMGIFVSWGLAALTSLAVGMALVVVFQPNFRPILTIRRDAVGSMLRFSGSNYVAETLRELPGFLLPVIVSLAFTAGVAGVDDVDMPAYLYIAWTIASGVMMVAYATGSSLLAEGSLDPRAFSASSLRAFQFMLLLLAVAIAVVFVFGGPVLSWFDGGRPEAGYRENAFWLLRLLSLSALPIAINTIYVTYKRMQRRMGPVLLVYGFVAVFTVGVGYALLEPMDLTGIGVAWLASNSLVAVVACILMTTGWQRARRKRRQARADATTS